MGRRQGKQRIMRKKQRGKEGEKEIDRRQGEKGADSERRGTRKVERQEIGAERSIERERRLRGVRWSSQREERKTAELELMLRKKILKASG